MQQKAAAPKGAPPRPAAAETPLGDIEAMLEAAKKLDTTLHDNDAARGACARVCSLHSVTSAMWGKSLVAMFGSIERKPTNALSPTYSSFPSISGLAESSEVLRASQRQEPTGVYVSRDVARVPYSAPKRARTSSTV